MFSLVVAVRAAPVIPALLAALLTTFAFHHAAADDKKPDPAPDPAALAEQRDAAVKKLLASLHPRQGRVDLHSGLATAEVPPQFQFLGPEDTEKVLVYLWGNPPSKEKPFGMIYPAGGSFTNEKSWAVIVQYDEDGHIKDDDANSIDYDKLLKGMKEGAAQTNKERVKQGYPAIELVGWAAPPRYDAAAHKLYWAKEIAFSDSPEHTLNYGLRILGRKGVLVLNVVSPISLLHDVEAATPQILSMVDFNPGNRYADFDKSTDKVATYGLAALVAGGIAAKAGLFKGLFVALLAAKKFIVLALVAVGGFIKRLFTGKKSTAASAATSPDLPPSPPPSPAA